MAQSRTCAAKPSSLSICAKVKHNRLLPHGFLPLEDRVKIASALGAKSDLAEVERLRAHGPVVEIKFPIIGKVWATTTYEAAGRVLKDSGTFTL
ncbi:MAG: hypothetical protein ACREDO_05480 [Methyloceanibacter sp.]